MKIGLILAINLSIVLFFGCGETPKKETRKPITLKMDIPDPKRLPQSKITEKKVPDIRKSNMKFKLEQTTIEKKIQANPFSGVKSCLTFISSLEQKKDTVQRQGGLWGSIEQSEKFKDFSPIGMQLDSKINKMTYALRHLCETTQGIDYSPMAKVALEHLKNKSEEDYRNELIALGQAPAKVDQLLDYTRFAQKVKNRTVDFKSIQKSTLQGASFIDHYERFFKKVKSNPGSPDNVFPDIQAFHEALSDFLANDKYVNMAVLEDIKLPYLASDGDM